MTERFFPTADEEYTAASWLTALSVMRSSAGKLPELSTTGKLCNAVAKDPENILNTFRNALRRSVVDGHTGEYIFLKVTGALDDYDRLTQGLSDAAFLLCDDPVATQVKEQTSIASLMPIVDELAEYYGERYFTDTSSDSLHRMPGGDRIKAIRIESDYWLREYDPRSN